MIEIETRIKLITFICLCALLSNCTSIKSHHGKNLIDEFTPWTTGHDPSTTQLLPVTGHNAVIINKHHAIIHVKFQVKHYGEVSFPINTSTPSGGEALSADLSKNKHLHITYRANQEFIVQLRQTGVHGGVHNYVTLPAVEKFTTATIAFSKFKGGKTELDLTDVAKFNFAFLSNNTRDGFAELQLRSFTIDGYKP